MAVFRCKDYPRLKVDIGGGKLAEFKDGLYSTTDAVAIEKLSQRDHIEQLGSALASEAKPKKESKAAAPTPAKRPNEYESLVAKAIKKEVLHLRGEKVFFKSKKVGDDIASAAARLEEEADLYADIEAEL